MPLPNNNYLVFPDFEKLLTDLVDSQRLQPSIVDELLPPTEQNTHPLEYLASLKLPDALHPGQTLELDQLTEWLARQVDQPLYQIDPLNIDTAATTAVMSQGYAKRHNILAVEVTSEQLVIASSQPWDKSWEDNVRHINRKEIKRVIANPEKLRRHIEELYQLSESVEGAVGKSNTPLQSISNFEQLLELESNESPDANDQHIINLVDWLLKYAFEQRASDIHIEPERSTSRLRFRIDGMLHLIYDLPIAVSAAVISRIKIQGRMNLAEKRKPQDGRLKTKTPEGQETELRLSTMPTAFGEKLVMRIFDAEVVIKALSELGFSDENKRIWHSMTTHPNGIILVTGPTGSGKTITLYSTLKLLATTHVNVCTIEDPIEMIEPSFNQTPIQPSIGLTFAAGLRALLRQDPDIIMVGEIRDAETAEMAMQAALTGHLVLSTMHTNDAPSAIIRMIELGVPPYLIRTSMLGVMAQRLVRKLCTYCRVPSDTDLQRWQELFLSSSLEIPKQALTAKGCSHCRETGYRGRTGIYELMPFTDKLPATVSTQTSADALRHQAIKQGMETLRKAGMRKVAQGITSIDEVLRVTSDH